MDFKQTKEQVEYCLEHYEATRDYDLYLVISVWKRFHQKEFVSFLRSSITSLGKPVPNWMFNEANMHDLPSFESIRRTRQKIQNQEKKFQPSEEIQAIRNKKEAEVREWSRE